MATLPRSAIDEYTRQLHLVSDGMKQALAAELETIDWSDMAAAKTRVLEVMQLYCGGATDAAAVLASNFYSLAREYATGLTYDALALSGRVPEATTAAVESFFAPETATPESIKPKLLSRLGYEVSRAAGDCVFINGGRDHKKPRYARVPSGSETCAFCLMLGSRGFVYSSARNAGFLNHYHDNCDCRVVPSWAEMMVEGYDPEAIYDQWQESIDAEARARAERKGTTFEEEKAHITSTYRKSASNAQQKAKARGSRSSGETTFYQGLRAEITQADASSDFDRAVSNVKRFENQGRITPGQSKALRIAISKRKEALGLK